MDSDEEVYDNYSDDGVYSEGDYGDEDADFEEDAGEEQPQSRIEESFVVLSEGDIRRRQERDINEVSNVLSVPKVWASLLLLHYDWSVSKLCEAWYSDEEKVRKTVGLLEEPMMVDCLESEEIMCRICFENYPVSKMCAAACGHLFCGVCWRTYVSISVSDGPGCLMLRCPEPKCVAAVDQDLVNELVLDEDKEKYSRYLLRSYVEARKNAKWCPAPGCEYAVEFVPGSVSSDVTCMCSHGFCWKCVAEAHRPVDCDTVTKWLLKNSAESENTNWILANSKSCPKCKRPIEKNQGCMHMTCTPPCKFEFCWLCLGDWSKHGERTGGYYACNRYEQAKTEGEYDESERIREMAKNMLERYTHYYERWAANHTSRKKAIVALHKLKAGDIDKLRAKLSEPLSHLNFISEAWQQIIECRRVLRWTYAYGFYLPGEEQKKTQLFEYLQCEAESGLERLHQCAEKELQKHLDANDRCEDFDEFKEKLCHLTTVTRNYFDNLVQSLENGLCDVD